MKKAAIFAAALALVLSLAACGNQDNNNQPNGGQTNNGSTTENGGNGNSTTGGNGSSMNGGTANGTSGSLTDPNGSTDSNNTGNNSTGTGTTKSANTNGAQSRNKMGNDLRRAADGVGDAVTDLVDDGRDALSRAASATTFERMLDNARVHDTDGILTDGENSRW